MAAKKEVSKKTAAIIIVIAIVVVLIAGYLLFFRQEKVKPVAGGPAQNMPPEMRAKMEQMGGGKGILAGPPTQTPQPPQ